jgi:uncharacterized membrane protein YbhN (UPF0104 family)
MAVKESFKSFIKIFIKLAITAACLLYVINKINWHQSWQTVKQSNLFWLLLSVLLVIISKVVASFRLNIYFRNINVHLTQKVNLQLYWLSMFYNIFLPGGIGGDAYKVILLNRTYQHPVKLLTAGVLLDRISGVAAIGILSVVYYCLVFHGTNYSIWLLLAILPAFVLYWLIVKKFFPSFVKGFWLTFWLGLTVQGLQVICIYCLLQALNLQNHDTEYVLIFLISSLIAVLPFTIGGLGAREVVFLWGSKQFLLNQNQSVCISLLFYLISAGISLIGIYWVYKNPLKKSETSVTI